MRSAVGGGAVENVITRRAFSPQLTERTGPEAAGPRNDDTFHEGCSVSAKGSSSTRPVDGSWFAARPADDDRSIDFIADTALTTSQSPALFPARVGRTAIAIYCLSRAGRYTPAVFASPVFDSSLQLSFYELPCRSCHRDDISRESIAEITALIISVLQQKNVCTTLCVYIINILFFYTSIIDIKTKSSIKIFVSKSIYTILV